MNLSNTTDQRFQIDAHIPGKKEGTETVIEVHLHRVSARAAWEAANAEEKADIGEEPVITRDLAALAKEHGVDETALRTALERHALFRAAVLDGRLRIS